MQENTQKKPDSELQLWAVTAPKKQTYKSNRQHPNARLSHQRTAGRPVESIRRRRAKRRRVLIYRCIALAIFALFLVGIFKLTGVIYRGVHAWIQTGEIPASNQNTEQDAPIDNSIARPDITVNLLEENPYSRPGTKLKKVKNIFVHYTANKGTSAAQNRSYFANLAETGERSASAHFIIGYEGEIIQCIPLEEQAYAVKKRNDDSVSIECCYLSEDGSFSTSTYNSLVELLSWLCGEYGLSEEDILRHYDEGGKKCPLYYVEHEDEWDLLLDDVAQFMKESASK
ncbi:MAG: N-acetylmuramoyl-L-alanine amidase [Lachnospiraceae bacterium]|nr:N-acetylmuramoyl-L-alanine amidase [Lachnospiraceae bacterium]